MNGDAIDLVSVSTDRKLETGSTQEMFRLLYTELRLLAAARIRREKPGNTLQATALVHEVIVRLMGADTTWDSKNHFYASAARAMRRILIEAARRKKAVRHGAMWREIELCESILGKDCDHEAMVDLDDALNHLSHLDDRAARIVELRVFAGLTFPEIAQVLSVSTATAFREWSFARAWLSTQLRTESAMVV